MLLFREIPINPATYTVSSLLQGLQGLLLALQVWIWLWLQQQPAASMVPDAPPPRLRQRGAASPGTIHILTAIRTEYKRN